MKKMNRILATLLAAASIGAAQLIENEQSIDQLMHRADQALYAAKSSGRNRVVAASWLQEPSEPPLLQAVSK